jgi:LacI family transcriptional regulator
MSVTVRQVAARAGVSPVVVSRVLHNKAASVRVSEATAERVRQAAKDLGYRCNVLARNFRQQQTRQIGVLHGIGFERPEFNKGSRYFAVLMDGLIEGAFKHGYSITLCPQLLGSSPEDAMSDGRFDGLVWYSAVPSEENRRMLMSASVPLVVIHANEGDFGGRFPTVICDNDQGIDLAVEHLYELGHRRIAYAMGGSAVSTESFLRRDAFRKSITARGGVLSDRDFLDVAPTLEEIDIFLQSPDRHSAVIVHNDDLASQILVRAVRAGVRVPEELSIVGFDSTDYCQVVRPSLTSINQPLATLGERAIDLLMSVINGEVESPPHAVLRCGLDIRESTTACNL